jgi:hypothetical protein
MPRKADNMFQSPYYLEMTMRWKQEGLARRADEVRAAAAAAPSVSPARRAVASALVRAGMFLNGGAYHCPEAQTQR